MEVYNSIQTLGDFLISTKKTCLWSVMLSLIASDLSSFVQQQQ